MTTRKKLNLAAALHNASGKTQSPTTPPAERPQSSPPAATSLVAPSRQGKKAVTGFFDPAVSRELKQIGLNRDLSVQALLTEAINDLLVKYGRSPIA
ncbi:ribbon-helix-helix domain-containing protein [Methylococcus sp. EFPC2]|uniref:ribbon-helix-helix domain-containing protein n=1 Tax=Methylococcus sp. EFPC2 TaxID=2812648 RepID=UPI0019671750|nr:ribbon-helix-helix domain-containing protein [Methylococcus sp. EFPC2]QSA99248.1 hypothetical protein JWZ97_19690 [Methylococcus sp. EFPC2]